MSNREGSAAVLERVAAEEEEPVLLPGELVAKTDPTKRAVYRNNGFLRTYCDSCGRETDMEDIMRVEGNRVYVGKKQGKYPTTGLLRCSEPGCDTLVRVIYDQWHIHSKIKS